MQRQKKEREVKISDLTRKLKLEKESAQQMKQVYAPKLKDTMVF